MRSLYHMRGYAHAISNGTQDPEVSNANGHHDVHLMASISCQILARMGYALMTFQHMFMRRDLSFPVVKPYSDWVAHAIAASLSLFGYGNVIHLCVSTRAHCSACVTEVSGESNSLCVYPGATMHIISDTCLFVLWNPYFYNAIFSTVGRVNITNPTGRCTPLLDR